MNTTTDDKEHRIDLTSPFSAINEYLKEKGNWVDFEDFLRNQFKCLQRTIE